MFEVEFLPTFIHIARRGVQGLQEGDLCLWETETPTLSVEALRQLLQKPLETAYHVEVAVQGNAYFTSPRLAYEGISDQYYSLKTFFDSALSEEAQPCPW